MSLRYLLAAGAAIVTWGWVGAQNYRAPVEWEINVEGGVDVLRREYAEIGSDFGPDVLVNGARQGTGVFFGASVMRRLAGLRALWGLRLDAHAGEIAHEELRDYRVEHRTATATLAYRFFPLDLHGDCDCPSWGSDPWVKKALFLEAGLGVGLQRYGATAPGTGDRTRIGAAYTARLGLSHRLTRAFDVYAAGGLHGVFADNEAFGLNDFAVRPTLGLTWRPGR